MQKQSSNTFNQEFQQLLEIPGALWGTDNEYFDTVGVPYPERLLQSETELLSSGLAPTRLDIPQEEQRRASMW